MGKNWIHRRENLTRIKRVTDCALMTWIKAWSCTRAVNRIRSCRFCWVLLGFALCCGPASYRQVICNCNSDAKCDCILQALLYGPVSACKGFSVWKYLDILHSKAPVTCLFGAVGWGADEAGHPFEEQTKKRPLRSALYYLMGQTVRTSSILVAASSLTWGIGFVCCSWRSLLIWRLYSARLHFGSLNPVSPTDCAAATIVICM